MTLQIAPTPGQTSLQLAPNFRSWQRDTFERGLLPVIGIAGGRGKSTVARMLDAILQKAHLRTALWTDFGVEIRGKRQRGEISGWSLALARLTDLSIDVAIQELDWSTINAVGLPPASYPILAVTNMLGSPDAPLVDEHAAIARRGAHRVANAVHRDGLLVICGDDPLLVESTRGADAVTALSSLSRETPKLRRHLESGGSGVWIERHVIRAGDAVNHSDICSPREIPAGMGGSAQFEVANALNAIAIAMSMGVDGETIRDALQEFEITPHHLPGSFNAYALHGYQVFVDRSVPSWHLRHLLRAANPGGQRRQITVLGDLETLPAADIQAIGRLLGRYAGAIILHSNKSSRHIDSLRKGIASNDFPPLVIHLPTERRALNRALKTARPEDVVLILTGADPGPATRAIQRQSHHP